MKKGRIEFQKTKLKLLQLLQFQLKIDKHHKFIFDKLSLLNQE